MHGLLFDGDVITERVTQGFVIGYVPFLKALMFPGRQRSPGLASMWHAWLAI